MDVNMALWSLVGQTDGVTKGILCLLLCVSVVCWAILFYKAKLIGKKTRELKFAQQLIHRSYTVEDLLAKVTVLQDTFAGTIIAQALNEFKIAVNLSAGSPTAITNREWQLLHTNLQHIIEDALSKEESYIPVLSTSATCATLIGLFGTVWGLIHAFIGIGIQKSADIASVAPGIAEALITTLAGLLVAIPALVMFNFLNIKLKVFEQNLMVLSEKCLSIMKLVSESEHIHGSHEKQAQPIKTVAVK
jgi:biopolymer transport protein TolQ